MPPTSLPLAFQPTHPAREEPAILEFAQEKSDKEGAGHEHQRQQGGVGLTPGPPLPGWARRAPVPRSQRSSCRTPRAVLAVHLRAVGDQTAVEGVLLEDLGRGQKAPSAQAERFLGADVC